VTDSHASTGQQLCADVLALASGLGFDACDPELLDDPPAWRIFAGPAGYRAPDGWCRISDRSLSWCPPAGIA